MGRYCCFHLCFRRRLHRRAIHHAFNCGGVREKPFFHAIRPTVGPDDESDDENDYREQSNQFRVYRKKYEFNRSLVVSEYYYFIVFSTTIALSNDFLF